VSNWNFSSWKPLLTTGIWTEDLWFRSMDLRSLDQRAVLIIHVLILTLPWWKFNKNRTNHTRSSIIMTFVDECGVILTEISAFIVRHFGKAPIAPQLIVRPSCCWGHVHAISEKVAFAFWKMNNKYHHHRQPIIIMFPQLEHKPSLWITYKENGP
jgi:hypothetical protein